MDMNNFLSSSYVFQKKNYTFTKDLLKMHAWRGVGNVGALGASRNRNGCLKWRRMGTCEEGNMGTSNDPMGLDFSRSKTHVGLMVHTGLCLLMLMGKKLATIREKGYSSTWIVKPVFVSFFFFIVFPLYFLENFYKLTYNARGWEHGTPGSSKWTQQAWIFLESKRHI